ncbi:MAG: YbbR-like domain-containing protein [Bacteroidales bacterium]|nr:YbbR-like domain-containing protein [Bacteroidales bacterium]
MDRDEDKLKGSLSGRLGSIRHKIVNRDVAVFSFFLILSFFLWFLNALGKDMTGTISFPAHYINISRDRALVSDLPDRISLTVRGAGYSILKHKLISNKPPLQIDLGKVNHRVIRDDQRYEYYILTFALREDFRRRLREEFEIMAVTPDTIHFAFEMIASKSVPVKPDVEAVTQKQYMIYGLITSNPDSVVISGPATVIDTIEAVSTKHWKIDQISATTTVSLQLEAVRTVDFSEKKVEVTIPVEQFTEAVREVPVTVINRPSEGTIRLFPERIKIYCNVALRDYNRFMASSIEAVTDMMDVDIRNTEKLEISLRNTPSYVSSLRFAPAEVEYIFEKN